MDEFEITRATWGLCNISGLSPEEYDEIFLPDVGKTTTAREYCDECDLRTECLDYGMDHNRDGIWGGTGRRQRIRLRSAVREGRAVYDEDGRLDVDNTLEDDQEPQDLGDSSNRAPSLEAEQFMVSVVLQHGSCFNSNLPRDEIYTRFVGCWGGKSIKAVAMCMGCPVQIVCKTDALERDVVYGVQGGEALSRRRKKGPMQPDVMHGKNIVDLALEELRNADATDIEQAE